MANAAAPLVVYAVTHGAQPQTRHSSGLQSHDGTDGRSSLFLFSLFSKSDICFCISFSVVACCAVYTSSCQCTLRDVTKLYPLLPSILTSHIVTPAFDFECDVIYGCPLCFRSKNDGNIVENIIKYCQTSKIAVVFTVFIHKTCNKVKSTFYTTKCYMVLIVAFKAANLQLEMRDCGVI